MLSSGALIGHFRPRNRILLPLLAGMANRKPTISTLTSTRLAFISSIICAGYHLKKEKKDGEVILRDFEITCKRPIFYSRDSIISVAATARLLRETEKFHLLTSTFDVEAGAHYGSWTLLYVKPGVKDFSYL